MLRARRAMLDQEDQMITYQDAVLEVAGVPVLYVPWFAHPDPNSERRSGLMTPDLGLSSKIGLFYEQPYYLVISPSEDVTISPMLSTNVNPLVKVDYRRRFFSGFIQAEGSFTHEQEFNSDGDQFGDDTEKRYLEFIKGEPVVHLGRQYQVMTNEPAYDQQIANMENQLMQLGVAPVLEPHGKSVRKAQ